MILVAAFSGRAPGAARPAPAEVLEAHVRYLASDRLAGRAVGTPGIELARDYIAASFARFGLLPGGDHGTYFQRFEVGAGVAVKEPAFLRIGEASLRLDDDWFPLPFSASGHVNGELVFAGYGITAKEYGYDDYEGLDARGKIAIVLRYEPAGHPFPGSPRYSPHAALRAKVANAREHGATGVILVDLSRSADALEGFPVPGMPGRGASGTVAVQVRAAAIEPWLRRRGISLRALKERIDREGKPASLSLGLTASIAAALQEIRAPAENVIGILPGASDRMKDEAIVIGAHYDHIGTGRYGTRDAGARGQIHHGADDNASGTAVLLEAARRLAGTAPRLPRTIVFVAFSGEELGLHGSRRYAENPPMPLSSTVAMINLDMVGRLRDGRLTAYGARSSAQLRDAVWKVARRLGLDLNERDGVGRSDHLWFYNGHVPVVHFTTGVHADYHRPGDTWDKLDFAGMERLTGLVVSTASTLAVRPERPVFASLPAARPGSGNAPASRTDVYLGGVPAYGDDAPGVRLAAVSPGSPAAAAGLRAGDVIVRFAGAKIESVEDLAAQLAGRSAGDEVEIVVLRGNRPLALKAVLRERT
ncbi:MAG TPA: M20/M25/M40 family metallo-hydrolase [candidate division Zixibacteria bacterium]|nr:M20/M25/M40 family metallo-hydrolase [candidate division Zixibacteria bacterium]